MLLVTARFLNHMLVSLTFFRCFRGMGRQAQLVWCNVVGFWVVGTATGYTLAFRFHMGVSGLWLGINAGVFSCGALPAI